MEEQQSSVLSEELDFFRLYSTIAESEQCPEAGDLFKIFSGERFFERVFSGETSLEK
jgi:hypothetical protein